MIWSGLFLWQLPLLAAELPAAVTGDPTAGPAGAPPAPAWTAGASPYLVVGGMAIILFFLMRMRRQQRTRPAQQMSSLADFKDQPRVRGDAERLAVDLEETARSVSALLDTKIRVLDKLIRDADERIVRLERLTVGNGAEAGAAPLSAREPLPPPPPPPPAEESLAHHRHIYGLADQGLSVQEIAEQSGHPRGEVELVLSLRKLKRSDQTGN